MNLHCHGRRHGVNLPSNCGHLGRLHKHAEAQRLEFVLPGLLIHTLRRHGEAPIAALVENLVLRFRVDEVLSALRGARSTTACAATFAHLFLVPLLVVVAFGVDERAGDNYVSAELEIVPELLCRLRCREPSFAQCFASE